jgi:hypothetical protein
LRKYKRGATYIVCLYYHYPGVDILFLLMPPLGRWPNFNSNVV